MVAAAFIAGAVPFANIAARRRAGVDLRDVGTGTVSGTGLFLVAGFGPLAGAGILEVAKGSVGPLLAGRERPGLAALAGGAAVAGHDWSPFLRGAGGRGLSPAIGALLAQYPVGAAGILGGLALGRLVRRTGLVSLAADVGVVALLDRRYGPGGRRAGLAVVVPIVLKRLLGNRRPRTVAAVVPRILLDRDTWRAAG